MATDLHIEDITTVEIDGNGIFDKLMTTINLHIQREYEEGRIKGSEYAKVYLGALQTVLAQSVQYNLQEEQTKVQVELLKLQVAEEQYKLDNLLPKELEKLEEEIKGLYVVRVGKDKEVAALGLDLVMRTQNKSPKEPVYTPNYVEEV